METRFTKASAFFRNISRKVSIFKDKWTEKTTALLRINPDDDCAATIADIITSATADSRRLLYVNSENRAETLDPALADNDRLLIFTPAYDSPDDPADYADLVISGIEQAVATTDIRTFIVDSVTRIAALSFGRNASPSYVMKRLVSLRMRHGLSLLVVTRPASRAVERALSCLADSTLTADPQESSSQICADRKAGFQPAPPPTRHPSETDHMPNLTISANGAVCEDIKMPQHKSASEMRHHQPDAQRAPESRFSTCANSQPDARRPETCAEKPTTSSDSVRQCPTMSDSKTPASDPKAPKTKAPKDPKDPKDPEPPSHDFQPLCEYYFDEGRAWTAPDLYATL